MNNIKLEDCTLIVTVGLPRSGKSTWARVQNHPIVCLGSIRYALHGERFIAISEPYVWAIAGTMVDALFLAGHQYVILDETNTTKKCRDYWVNNRYKTLFKVFSTTKDECIARAVALNDESIIPIIESMADNYEYLSYKELKMSI